ncbi:MAG: ABC transporter, permease protein 1 (cluster 1, maltose/g3p/polyamine/iron) [uncultured Thermomicrobiales bacterium]|uniref:ABC transporter, permease protein 1 (Cluster 1, maltose/g3p/polyamine/iron) n=1 Tax=uncultured Thermomicrobiales bacterium TaxID=1645740 RepID=A0A6J4ULN6_9BACT|nr:MAG: ABC transporter, permease protein 1 (cluster 1, maltose/g3p/polyamine/iron) [uncultured Thermomicrobiales bacterium]
MAVRATTMRPVQAVRPRPKGARLVLRQMRRQWSAYLFLAPVLLLFAVFTFFSVGYAFYLSFHQWNILEPVKPFVGLDNYRRLVQDDRFHEAVVNTLYYTVASVPLTIGFGLFIALLLNNQIRARGLFRAFFYLPVITPLVIASIIWKWVYNGDFGLFNYYLIKLHLIDETLLWLSDQNLAMPAVIITSVWKSVGFAMVVYLAGLQAIPEEYYDAAKIDGATGWRRLRDITVPLLSTTTMFLVVVSVLGSFQVFTQIFVMTGGGPLGSTRTVVWYIYQTAFKNFDMGYAAALAFALFAMMFGFTLVQFRFLRREVEY